MSIITAIKQQKNKNRANIYLDGKYALALSWQNCYKLGLAKGNQLDEDQLKKIYHKVYFEKFQQKALNLLAIRPRSSKEIQNRLSLYCRSIDLDYQSQLATNLIQDVIHKLSKQKLLNDEEFALWWLKQRQLLKPIGKKLLILELKKKGISQNNIDDLLAKHYSDKKEEKEISRLLTKKIRLLKNLSTQKKKTKLLNFLYRRGFSYDISRTLVDQMLQKS